MSFAPTLLEDSLDPWLAIEPDPGRRQAVIRFLMELCESDGTSSEAHPVPGTRLPAFAAMVPDAAVVVVWVIAEKYSQIAVRYLYDVATGQRYGG